MVEPLEVVGAVTLEFSVLTQVIDWVAADASNMRITFVCPSTAEVVVSVMVIAAADELVKF